MSAVNLRINQGMSSGHLTAWPAPPGFSLLDGFRSPLWSPRICGSGAPCVKLALGRETVADCTFAVDLLIHTP